MICKGCGRPGPENHGGWHADCFTAKISQKTPGSTSTRFEFATGRTVREEKRGPQTEAEWSGEAEWWKQKREAQEAAEAEERRQAEEKRQREESDRRWGRQRGPFGFGTYTYQNFEAQSKDETVVTVTVDLKRVKSLLMLCHPDKHGNSETATEVTRWLIEIKERIQV